MRLYCASTIREMAISLAFGDTYGFGQATAPRRPQRGPEPRRFPVLRDLFSEPGRQPPQQACARPTGADLSAIRRAGRALRAGRPDRQWSRRQVVPRLQYADAAVEAAGDHGTHNPATRSGGRAAGAGAPDTAGSTRARASLRVSPRPRESDGAHSDGLPASSRAAGEIARHAVGRGA